jgi:hypothetical protein
VKSVRPTRVSDGGIASGGTQPLRRINVAISNETRHALERVIEGDKVTTTEALRRLIGMATSSTDMQQMGVGFMSGGPMEANWRW